jgi:hypothetical protein
MTRYVQQLGGRRPPAIATCILLFALFAIGCSRDHADESRVETPDSLGWRYAYVAGADLTFRYPASRVDSVVNRWTPDCVTATARRFGSSQTGRRMPAVPDHNRVIAMNRPDQIGVPALEASHRQRPQRAQVDHFVTGRVGV